MSKLEVFNFSLRSRCGSINRSIIDIKRENLIKFKEKIFKLFNIAMVTNAPKKK